MKHHLRHSIGRKILKFIFGAILVVGIVAGGYFFYTKHHLTNFLQTISDQSEETQTYSVLTLKTSSFNDIKDLKNQKIGFLSTNPYLEQAEAKLEEAVEFTPGLENDVDGLLKNLETGNDLLAISLENSYLDTLDDEEIIKKDDLKIIYTYEIKLSDTNENQAEKTTFDQPFVIYISGSDSRGTLSEAARSDVNILAVVDPKNAKVLLVNTPRDYYVQLHDTTGLKDKLTHAGIYGINMSKSTLEDLYGINIDYTAKVGFKAVTGIVDAIDGIEIDSDKAMTLKSEDGHTCTYVEGKQHLSGACALRYARERKSYKTGDRHRGENQQQVITAIIDKISANPAYLIKWPQILAAAEGSLETSATFNEITAFVKQETKNPRKWQVESISVDGTGSMQPTYSMGANRKLYVMLPDTASLEAAKAKMLDILR